MVNNNNSNIVVENTFFLQAYAPKINGSKNTPPEGCVCCFCPSSCQGLSEKIDSTPSGSRHNAKTHLKSI